MEYSNGSLWKCANPFTDCGRAKTVRRRHTGGGRSEEVACCKCGFVARVDKAVPLGTKPAVRKILTRGLVFDSHILDSLAAGVSKETLRRTTGMAFYTFDRILKDLGVGTKESACKAAAGRLTSQLFTEMRESYRRSLSEYVSAHPGATRTSISVDLHREYAWLLTNDREWYEANGPAVRGASKIPPWMRTDRRAGV